MRSVLSIQSNASHSTYLEFNGNGCASKGLFGKVMLYCSSNHPTEPCVLCWKLALPFALSIECLSFNVSQGAGEDHSDPKRSKFRPEGAEHCSSTDHDDDDGGSDSADHNSDEALICFIPLFSPTPSPQCATPAIMASQISQQYACQ